jgi:hypothetical protein
VPVIQRRSKYFLVDVCMLIVGGTRDRLDLSKVIQNFGKTRTGEQWNTSKKKQKERKKGRELPYKASKFRHRNGHSVLKGVIVGPDPLLQDTNIDSDFNSDKEVQNARRAHCWSYLGEGPVPFTLPNKLPLFLFLSLLHFRKPCERSAIIQS